MTYSFNHFIRLLTVVWAFFLIPISSVLANPNTSLSNLSLRLHNAGPEDPVEPACCAYSLQFVNLYEGEGIIKKIRVSAMCDTEICCAESDEWAQDGVYPKYVDWYPSDGSPVPFGSAIDNGFLIFLNKNTDPHDLLVEWFDSNDAVVCSHTIQISCSVEFDEDAESDFWSQFTSTTALNDPNLFVFAVREPDADEDGCDDNEQEKEGQFDTDITCNGAPNYNVVINCNPSNYNNYQWTVNGPSAPTFTQGSSSITMTVGVCGTYNVGVTADDPNTSTTTPDNLSGSTSFTIPCFNSMSFSVGPVPLLCGSNITFTMYGASDPTAVASVKWSCPNPFFNLTGNSASYNFTTPGTYTVTMKVTDIYGCEHTVSKPVVVTTDCKAGLKVKSYYLCPDDCEDITQVVVTFQNTSTGGICPDFFDWNFGDPGSANNTMQTTYTGPSSSTTVTHTYTAAQVNFCHGQNYTVSVKMTDSATPTPCNSTASIPLFITPCNADFTYTVCPNGKVFLKGNLKGTWSFPGASILYNDGTDAPDADGLRQNICIQYTANGNKTITFEGHCSTGGRCPKTKTVAVELIDCYRYAKDKDKKHVFSESGKDYRMHCKLAQRKHKIKVKTKLKRKHNAGIKYWSLKKAHYIEAGYEGDIYYCDTDCSCRIPEHRAPAPETKNNKSNVKLKDPVNDAFRTRELSLTSTHKVQVKPTSALQVKNLQIPDNTDNPTKKDSDCDN